MDMVVLRAEEEKGEVTVKVGWREGLSGQGRHTYLYNGVVQVLLNWAGTVSL